MQVFSYWSLTIEDKHFNRNRYVYVYHKEYMKLHRVVIVLGGHFTKDNLWDIVYPFHPIRCFLPF